VRVHQEDQVQNLLLRYNILSDDQSGFRHRDSTINQLLVMYDIMCMDETWVNQNHCTDYICGFRMMGLMPQKYHPRSMRVRVSLDFDILREFFISLCIIETIGAIFR
jgi:hypothetical protein